MYFPVNFFLDFAGGSDLFGGAVAAFGFAGLGLDLEDAAAVPREVEAD